MELQQKVIMPINANHRSVGLGRHPQIGIDCRQLTGKLELSHRGEEFSLDFISRDTAFAGGIAVLDGEATVKTFKRSGNHVWLMPHNPAYTPIPGDEAEILGKVVAVLRRV